MNESIFVLKGNVVYSESAEKLEIRDNNYIVVENGK